MKLKNTAKESSKQPAAGMQVTNNASYVTNKTTLPRTQSDSASAPPSTSVTSAPPSQSRKILAGSGSVISRNSQILVADRTPPSALQASDTAPPTEHHHMVPSTGHSVAQSTSQLPRLSHSSAARRSLQQQVVVDAADDSLDQFRRGAQRQACAEAKASSWTFAYPSRHVDIAQYKALVSGRNMVSLLADAARQLTE